MTHGQPPGGQFDQKLDQLFAGELSPHDHRGLADSMREDPRQLDRYLDRVDLEAGLAGQFRGHRLLDQPPGRSVRRPRRRLPGRWLAAVITIAASMLLAIGFATGWRSGQPVRVAQLDTPVVPVPPVPDGPVVSQVAAATLFGRPAPSLHERLPIGREWVLTAGMLQLTFGSGAEVIVESPAVLEVVAAERLAVGVGRLSVYAPPGAEGFEIITPEARVIDRGTRFALTVGEIGETEVQVIEGQAELWPTAQPPSLTRASPVGPRSVHLIDGQATRVDGPTTRPIAYDGDDYRFRLPDRVIDYQTAIDDRGLATDLRRVTVQRGGRLQTYEPRQWIAASMESFDNGPSTVNFVMPRGQTFDPSQTSTVNRTSLLTGWINPAEMTVRFEQSVVNGPGQDVLLFDLQSMIDPAGGDGFYVRPAGDRDSDHDVHSPGYDLVMTTPGLPELAPFDLMQWHQHNVDAPQLLSSKPSLHRSRFKFWASVVGLDLSSMGVADGEAIDRLVLRDDLQDEHHLDPVLIIGLPPIDTGIPAIQGDQS